MQQALPACHQFLDVCYITALHVFENAELHVCLRTKIVRVKYQNALTYITYGSLVTLLSLEVNFSRLFLYNAV